MMMSSGHEQRNTVPFGKRRVAPRACVVDVKPHIRTFLTDALEELGFVTRACGRLTDIAAALEDFNPDLVVLGLLAPESEVTKSLHLLKSAAFRGRVMMFGGRAATSLIALHELGEESGLAMLPPLATPYRDSDLWQNLSPFLPITPSPGLAVDVEEAMRNGWLEMWYQPKIDLREMLPCGAEALIRWRHPERGLLPPGEFIQVVNTSSISTQVALWVLKTAAAQSRAWEIGGSRIRVSLNLAPSLIHSGELPAAVRSVLIDTGLSPSLLELEVTEDIVLVDEKLALSTFRQVQELGVQIAFDDFGTGYASLSYLKKFPLDILKIDRSFVAELRQKRDDAAIVEATISLGKHFHLSVIAEGIEDAETAAILHEMGCDEGQGYHFGKPMPAAEFARQFLCAPKMLQETAA